MRRRFPGLRVFGGDDRVEGMTDIPKDDFEIDDFSHKITAIATPCHTKESICYLLKDGHTDGAKKILFTGDTLFLAGCGRFFEGKGDLNPLPPTPYTHSLELDVVLLGF